VYVAKSQTIKLARIIWGDVDKARDVSVSFINHKISIKFLIVLTFPSDLHKHICDCGYQHNPIL
jgi:hypothetical protein